MQSFLTFIFFNFSYLNCMAVKGQFFHAYLGLVQHSIRYTNFNIIYNYFTYYLKSNVYNPRDDVRLKKELGRLSSYFFWIFLIYFVNVWQKNWSGSFNCWLLFFFLLPSMTLDGFVCIHVSSLLFLSLLLCLLYLFFCFYVCFSILCTCDLATQTYAAGHIKYFYIENKERRYRLENL